MVSYNRLRHLLVDKGLKTSYLQDALGISRPTISKINRDEYIHLEIIDRICNHFHVPIDSILEIKKNPGK